MSTSKHKEGEEEAHHPGVERFCGVFFSLFFFLFFLRMLLKEEETLRVVFLKGQNKAAAKSTTTTTTNRKEEINISDYNSSLLSFSLSLSLLSIYYCLD